MICGLAIGLAIFGLIALVRGKMTISKTKVVVGIPARLIGLLALMPLPVIFGIGFVFGIMNVGADPEKLAKDNQALFAGIEVGVVILTAILVFVLGAALAISPREAERRERAGRYEDDEDDYEDDRRDRRNRDRDYDRDEDEDEDDRPRRRRNDDYDDDRPRR